MFTIGLIGCGMVAGYGHLPGIAGSSDWRLAALADVDPARLAQACADYPQAQGYADYRQLLEHPGLDALVIATHMDTHHEIALAAMQRGLHVLCEKPMASTPQQCREMVQAAHRHGRLLVVNFNSRSAGVYRIIQSHIAAGELGPIRVVRIALIWSAHQWQPPQRMENFMRNGGPITDSGVHFFETTRWFTGQEFTRIDAQGLFLPPYDNPQHVIATCWLSGGAIALIEAGWTYTKTTQDRASIFTIDAIGDDGAISYDDSSNRIRLYTRNRTLITPFDDSDKNFGHVYERLARSIEHGRVVDLATGEDGLKATVAALDALESARRNRPPA